MNRESIKQFTGENRFLSNFYHSKITVWHKILVQTVQVTTAEHLYQSYKTQNPEMVQRILISETPGKAKRLGRKCGLISGWDQVKLGVMHHVVEVKFTEGTELSKKLMLTEGKILEEGNTWKDTFWGVDTLTGQRENWLGKILMLRRSVLLIDEWLDK